MNPKLTQLMDQYLSGSLSPEELAAFEVRLSNNADLRSEVELQKNVMDAAKRAAQRAKIKNSAKQYRNNRLLKQTGLSIIIVGLFTAATVMLMNIFSKDSAEKETLAPLSKEIKDKLDKNQDFDNIPIQYFQIPENGSVQLSDQGVLISVPETAFLKDGKPYKGNVILQYQEAIKGVDIIKSGLSTMTGDELLETQGMFSVAGYTEKGKQLEFNPEVGVYIQSPIDQHVDGMEKYEGNKLADGTIDWQNPEPFKKIPVAVDMADLDFYPVCYEGKLDEVQWKTSKKSRDSLYLSLENSQLTKKVEPTSNATVGLSSVLPAVADVLTIDTDSLKKKIYRKIEHKKVTAVPVTPVWEYSVEMLENDEAYIIARSTIPPSYCVFSSVHNAEKTVNPTHAFRIICPNTSAYLPIGKTEDITKAKRKENAKGVFITQSGEIAFRQKVQIQTKRSFVTPFNLVYQVALEMKRGDVIFSPSIQTGNVTIMIQGKKEDETTEQYLTADTPCISPSKVMGFWNPAFNNTNLATREFERRMPEIHKTCNDEVLDLYLNNLHLPISEIDEMVFKKGYPQFDAFAKEDIGRVNTDDPHYAGLKAFYDKAVSALKADAKRNIENEQERLKKWNEHLANERRKDVVRSNNRMIASVQDEANFNRKNLVAQMRKTNGFTIRNGSFGSMTARINCDAARMFMAAVNQQQMEEAANVEVGADAPPVIPRKSSTKQIYKIPEYNECKVKVPNASKYLKLYTYVFAHGVNSYQRMNGKDGLFTFRLNADNIHDIGVVGITKDGYEYFQQMTLKGGDLGEIKMEIVSESKLEASINQLNGKRVSHPMDISQDLEWLKSERKNYDVQKSVRDMKAFRESIKEAIFPCYSPFDCEADNSDINSSSDMAEEIKNEDPIEVLAE